MAQTTFTPFAESDALNASTMNTLFTNIRTQSTSVNGSNIRIEGLERHAFASNAVVKYALTQNLGSATVVSYGSSATGAMIEAVTPTWATVQSAAGTLLRIDNGGAGFSYNNTNMTGIVRASTEIRRLHGVNGNDPESCQWAFSLFYLPHGGAATEISLTRRVIQYRSVSGSGTTMVPAAESHFNSYGTMTICHNLYINANYDWIELRVSAISGTPDHVDEYLYMSEAFIELTVWEH